MRPVVGAAVDDRRKGCRELHHIAAEALTEAVGREFDRTESPVCRVVRRIQDVHLRRGIRLTGQINTAAHAETVEVLRFLKRLPSERLCNAHQRHVTGLLEGAGHIKSAVTGPLAAVNQGALYVHLARAGILLLPGNLSVFECAGNRKDLCRGSGLVDRAHAEVVPEFLRRLLAGHLLQFIGAVILLQVSGVV